MSNAAKDAGFDLTAAIERHGELNRQLANLFRNGARSEDIGRIQESITQLADQIKKPPVPEPLSPDEHAYADYEKKLEARRAAGITEGRGLGRVRG